MDAIHLKVLDLSHHNCGPSGDPDDPIDFAALAAFGIRGVILKASQGARNVDHTYDQRRADARAAGLSTGAYHFAEAGDSDEQVKHFLDCAKPDAQTFMALDHEPYQNGNNFDLLGAQSFLESLRDQIAAIGLRPRMYSGNLIKEQLGKCDDDGLRDFFGQFLFWLCEYGPRMVMVDSAGNGLPWDAPMLWQFAGDGIGNRGITVPGLFNGHKVDMNSFAGSDAELAAQWAA